MSCTTIGKLYTRLNIAPPATRRTSRRVWLFRALQVPLNLLRAGAAGVPGVRFHFALIGHALRCVAHNLTLAEAHDLMVRPMDSVRYFEFGFLWQAVRDRPTLGEYLDVSSPRLFSFRALVSGKVSQATIANPDAADLIATNTLFSHAGIAERCEFRESLVSDLAALGRTFDTISCISVLEHIPPAQTRDAVADMWRMLKPGGRLLLSVPCAKVAFDEYINFNEYGLLNADDAGFVFGQRFFDDHLIRSQIYAETGEPARVEVYGEIAGGEFFVNRQQKLSDPDYPYWQEPLLMAKNFRFYDRIDTMPGLGVIAMEFIKP